MTQVLILASLAFLTFIGCAGAALYCWITSPIPDLPDDEDT